ncbi:redoxin domain-containing protein [Thalassoglobus sp. JC818]|uniref:redoxin domain-containing protein n=1 Tax=Thalassoglobus sp. JC818 TaxID=3232136 RepID=UPI0034591522
MARHSGSFLLVIMLSQALWAEEPPSASLHDLSLPGVNGKLVSVLGEESDSVSVVCFLGSECPLARLYGPRLDALSEKWKSKGVRFIGINSNSQDSIEDLRIYLNRTGIEFPVLKDRLGTAADLFGATRTPEVFVVDSLGVIRYQGRIDDQYQPGLSRSEPEREDLKVAIEQLMSGQKIAVARTEPVGCLIGRIRDAEESTSLTYAKEISRILQNRCVECHREGEIGPFALTDFEEVQGWGEMLLEVIDQKRMPPWHANPDHGEFLNARSMPQDEIEQLREWVRGGMPFGDEKDLPPPVPPAEKWQLKREPDLVLDMHSRPFNVPAEGTVEYQYFVVDPQFEEDQWIVGAQVVPGNRSVVHHCLVFIRPPDGEDFRRVRWLTGFVPGQLPVDLPENYGIFVPAGSRFVFQMHYTPTGAQEEDLSQLALLLANDEDVTHEVATLIGINRDFEIPPNVSSFAVDGDVTYLPDSGKLIGIAPHMHVRGKAFSVDVVRDGERDTVLDVPHYDFNWQHFYQFVEPLPLAELKGIEFRSVFDNSEKNPVNPDPEQYVTWGDQTWEEMALAFFTVAIPRDQNVRYRNTSADSVVSVSESEREEQATKFVDQFFGRFDRNKDGKIVRSELPIAMDRYGFRELDRNRDGFIDPTEVRHRADAEFRRR